MKKILLLLVIFLFLFLRFYKIDTSLFFFNDMGRDFLVLQEWQEKGKPPLLGPQTSALPINQSPIYFYYLYPFYLLTHGSVYASLIANAFLYVSFFLFTFFYFKKHSSTLLLVFFLISIHPQYIIQSRFVWNPSLVTPFLIIGLLSLLDKKPLLSAATFAAAVSLSYSTAPLLIAVLITYLVFYRPQIIKFILGLMASLFILNLPMLLFEIKYQFQLTKSLITRGAEPQIALTFFEKTKSLSQYIFNTPNQTINLSLFFGFIVLSCIAFVKTKNIYLKKIGFLFLLTVTITYISPITIHSHYIFALTSLLFVLIAFLPQQIPIFTTILLTIVFCLPFHFNGYFQSSPRTFNQMLSCFQKTCFQIKQPLFLSVTSSYHPFHNGPEHQYIAKKAGCNILKIENNPQATNSMLIVEDGGHFDPIKTKYYELTQFGEFTIQSVNDCLSNFKIYQIIKSN